MKPCPYCAEKIQDSAIKCRHCGSMLNNAPGSMPQMVGVATDKTMIVLDRDWMRFMVCNSIAIGLLYAVYYVVATVGSHWGWLILLAVLGLFYASYQRTFGCAFCSRGQDISCFELNKECKRCNVLHIIEWTNKQFGRAFLTGLLLLMVEFGIALLLSPELLALIQQKDSKDRNSPQGEVSTAILRVLEQDRASNQPGDSARTVAERIQTIDLQNCPLEFQEAYRNHVRAWTMGDFAAINTTHAELIRIAREYGVDVTQFE